MMLKLKAGHKVTSYEIVKDDKSIQQAVLAGYHKRCRCCINKWRYWYYETRCYN